MNDDNPRRVYIGSYEGGTAHIIIPAPALARANEVLDAERARREAEAAKAKLQILQSAQPGQAAQIDAGRVSRTQEDSAMTLAVLAPPDTGPSRITATEGATATSDGPAPS